MRASHLAERFAVEFESGPDDLLASQPRNEKIAVVSMCCKRQRIRRIRQRNRFGIEPSAASREAPHFDGGTVARYECEAARNRRWRSRERHWLAVDDRSAGFKTNEFLRTKPS